MKKRNRGVVLNKTKVRYYAQAKGMASLLAFEMGYIRYFSISEGQNIGAPRKAWQGEKLDKSFAKKIAEVLGLQDYQLLLLEPLQSPWASLIENKSHQVDMMTFQLADIADKKLIDIEDFQKDSLNNLDEISIQKSWYLNLKGKEEDQFFILLQSQDMVFQLAPLNFEGYISLIPKRATRLRYPAKQKPNFTFGAEYGLGWRLCTVIRSSYLPISIKSVKTGFTLSLQALDEFALRLTEHKNIPIAVDFYEFMLVA